MSEGITPQDWNTFLKVLRTVSADPADAPDMTEAKGLIAKINKQARKENRKRNLHVQQQQDKQLKETTSRCQQEQLVKTPLLENFANTPLILNRPAKCYICKESYKELDPFYHLLCPSCSETNHYWRERKSDFKTKTVLITGARIKIGYALSLRLLRSGAQVIATTRFPKDAAKRYAAESDFNQWKDQLELYALDLRHLPSVQQFTNTLKKRHHSLDCIFNNAAQTLKRPPQYEQTLLAAESTSITLPNVITTSSVESDLTTTSILYDYDNEPVDLSPVNSWTRTLEDTPILELLETHLITSFAPFILNSQLKPLLTATSSPSFIINVSAMEGQFARKSKTPNHPHTNMAKASMNMMTRTSAEGYAKENIYMNSVDTGWITNENPHDKKHQQRANGFVPPLDVIDGASRVLAPVIDGLNGQLRYGKFYKDYNEHEW